MNLIDVIVRVFLILFFAYGITIGTIYLVTLAKIDIKDVSQRNGVKFMSIALIGNFSLIVVVYLMMHYLDKKDLFSLGFYITKVNVLLGLIMFILTVFIALLFVYVLQQMGMVKFKIKSMVLSRMKKEWTTFFLPFFVLFLAALQEEIMYRGYFSYIFQGYGMLTAMLLSSSLFTVWHFLGNRVNIFQVIEWFVCGILLFYLYDKSHSIWLVTFLHLSRNLTNVFIWNIADKYSFLKFDNPIKPRYKTVHTILWTSIIASLTFIIFDY
ncbi:type II CAAX endopeptidase family protein [Neobacillus sp. PS3-40]|uniref:CPBP family intramembrane glutamic endopeptidase n=1 Tax=Neobacillus sp. PS3-40 TaxID=3070679 RepID=UPI0027DF4519|nr:type II CAAX endopeptidase family protein [Neobacillus sp. PS3-40]WML43245.1 type II CAAX endopeptidase family protein [Neobacillus sp. PS3-40]